MHSILFWIDKPTEDTHGRDWRHVVQELATTIPQSDSVKHIGQGALLFLSAGGLHDLSRATLLAKEKEFEPRILVIEQATDWKEPVQD